MTNLAKACPLVLVGAGKMGGALLTGWLASGIDPDGVVIIDPSPAPELAALIAEKGLRHETSAPADLVAAVLVLAVKPQVLDAVLPPLKPLVGPQTITLSVVAGKTIASIAGHLGPAAHVRSIPNTPAAVGRGITIACGNERVGPAERALVTDLLSVVGQSGWVEDEALIDSVTAVSGSGPAYVFLMVECLAEAGRKLGLPADLAMQCARATIEGAGELLFRSPLTPDVLRQNVTSPKGTTAAALDVLMGPDGLQPLMDTAVAAAARRSRELAG